MPVFKVSRTVECVAYIEAPTKEIAVAEAKTWSRIDWGWEDEDVYSEGTSTERPDITVDLRGQVHDHNFDDEDTGGCIYCDEPKPVSPGEGGGNA